MCLTRIRRIVYRVESTLHLSCENARCVSCWTAYAYLVDLIGGGANNALGKCAQLWNSFRWPNLRFTFHRYCCSPPSVLLSSISIRQFFMSSCMYPFIIKRFGWENAMSMLDNILYVYWIVVKPLHFQNEGKKIPCSFRFFILFFFISKLKPTHGNTHLFRIFSPKFTLTLFKFVQSSSNGKKTTNSIHGEATSPHENYGKMSLSCHHWWLTLIRNNERAFGDPLFDVILLNLHYRLSIIYKRENFLLHKTYNRLIPIMW